MTARAASGLATLVHARRPRRRAVPQAGRKIAYRNVPESEYATVLAKDGIPDAIAKARASWDVGIAAGALFDNNGELRRLIGRRTTPLNEFVARRSARTSPRLADRSTGRRAPG